MNKLKYIAILTLVTGLLPSLLADVYLLKPGASEEAIHAMLKPRNLMKEKVKVNGSDGTLSVNSTDLSITECHNALDEVLKKYKGRQKHGAILIDIPKDHYVTRYYIFSMGKQYKTVVFQLDMPKEGLKDDAAQYWPTDIPSPGGGNDINQVMTLSKRGTIYATFSSDAQKGRVFHSYDAQLSDSGWSKVSSDKKSGAIYMKADSKQLLIFNTLDNGKRTHAAVYIYKVKHTDGEK